MTRKVLLLLVALMLAGCIARSDSDPPGGFSGLSVFKDHLTGCEYLARPAFVPLMSQVLTPRMGADGRQLCRKLNGAGVKGPEHG